MIDLQTQLGLRQVKLSFKITKYVRHLLRTCFRGDQIHLFIFFLFSPSLFLSFAREGDESLSWDLTPKSFPSVAKMNFAFVGKLLHGRNQRLLAWMMWAENFSWEMKDGFEPKQSPYSFCWELRFPFSISKP